jgi:hypothetical protein
MERRIGSPIEISGEGLLGKVGMRDSNGLMMGMCLRNESLRSVSICLNRETNAC